MAYIDMATVDVKGLTVGLLTTRTRGLILRLAVALHT